MEKCKQTSKHKCMFTISIFSSKCNYSMKRHQFFRLWSCAQNTDVDISGNSVKLHYWPKKKRQLLVHWTTSYLLSYQDCHHLSAAARFLHQDQRISQILPVNRKHQQIQWRRDVQACVRETDADNPDMQALGSLGQAHKKKTRWTRKIQRKAFLIGCSPLHII